MKEISTEQLKRTKTMWDGFANEDGEMDAVNSTLYWYGSELGTLRIMAKYRQSNSITFGYSKNLETFYVALWLN